ncbi:DDE superfamily endonuclease [Acidocella aminolytica 101 = DSM 11237]|nr:DDE superfamily endonuclease [Acidocella aminolytica 101 = DSM 11237]
MPADLDIHVVMDNYGTHKTKLIRNWFVKRPRWHVHYTPTSASWINQVERFFALLTDRAIGRGVFRSVTEPERAITTYIDTNNADPKPFRWTKSADDILGLNSTILPAIHYTKCLKCRQLPNQDISRHAPPRRQINDVSYISRH